ncbi:hypothetical protein, partial [Bacteroides uniformis]|uniref:hypothetical protein n=1 Tax=Bacteroides uniformis TaxID=820 RepID=UPI00207AE611
PDVQVYQADKVEYTPDYTLTPLTLFPRCNATDPDAVTKVGAVNASLVNMKWYERLNGVRTLITSANKSYVITETGAEKGKIQVKKNTVPGSPVTLEFYAEYVDVKRTGQTHVYRFSRLVRAVDGSEAQPKLMVDSPSALDWNPCRDIARQAITARLLVGDVDVTATNKCKFFFYRKLNTGALEQITDGNGDNDWEFVSLTKNVLTIDRDYIGHEHDIDYVSTTIRRRIPAIEIDWEGFPQQVADGTKMIYPKPVIRDTAGIVPNPQAILECEWYTKTAGASSYVLAAAGYSPSIPVTSDGKYVTDDSGKFIVARKRDV